ncbi:MAG TPA: isochorismatase family cysteine hydrolase [Chitinophagaceae bacterium]|jgi:nicotinamidase-related amidase|nr:isochorismatase family cysteine hydrolase [Chitinophagaceae bacterium]
MAIDSNQPNSALLVMDIQPGTVQVLKDNSPVLSSVALAIDSARSAKIPVIFIVVGFRKGYPEVSPANKSFSVIKTNTAFTMDTEEAYKMDSSVAPKPDDIVIVKKRVSAFTGSDLEVVLRSQEIKHIVLAGIATSGVVLSTVREAADKDYKITVLADCCADRDEEVHRVLLTKVFPRQAEVMDAAAWADQISR